MGKDVMVTNASTSFLVVVPRKFSHGTLSISTVASDGFLTVTVPSRAGLSATMKTVAAGQPAEVDLDWSTLAVATRAFKVTVSAVDTSVQLRDINLTLTP